MNDKKSKAHVSSLPRPTLRTWPLNMGKISSLINWTSIPELQDKMYINVLLELQIVLDFILLLYMIFSHITAA